ncbi:MAG: YraN family protein [Patescibacteria group bacterium]|nr:YraN family protein [Patescibacteria group bacterium]
MSYSLDIGKTGEETAKKYLESTGYTIIEERFRSKRWGELDLVCVKGSLLVFVEVKTRASPNFGNPAEAVGYYKQRALKRAALYYCKTHPNCSKSLRMDVIAITNFDDGKNLCEIKHYKNAF